MATALSLTNLTLKSKTILISLFRFSVPIQEWLEGVKVRGGGHISESRDLLKSQGVRGGLKVRESRCFNNLDTIFEVEV